MKEIKCKTFEEEREKIILSKLLPSYKKNPNNWYSYKDVISEELLSHEERIILKDLEKKGLIFLQQTQVPRLKLTEKGVSYASHLKTNN